MAETTDLAPRGAQDVDQVAGLLADAMRHRLAQRERLAQLRTSADEMRRALAVLDAQIDAAQTADNEDAAFLRDVFDHYRSMLLRRAP